VCAAAEAAAYLCGNNEGEKTVEDIAHDTASAYALAVASASAECKLEGSAYVQVDASASAEAKAKVWVAAFADAMGDAGDCQKCNAYALSFGYVEENVFLKAVADASVKVCSLGCSLFLCS